ncbi:restriction endonuclease subunit S [Collimonas sp. OK412]|jgi:type I restriction enzyme S subunit|uniref:restriction endonuclease subunit S n=1 Tax=Collimonas sp. (strain OK412) TaxID=1801619 RepID=UPI0008F169D9|nr:restriction endonuclease subunit S [Collimonas sp. OK412]SFD18685.1 type I restriction enzyme, S subunit [Collimonas sp. OK412]
MIPKGWHLSTFGQVTTVGSGQVDPTQAPYSDMTHVGPENIESGTGRIIEPKRCKELGLISGKYEFDENAIVYSKIRPHLNKVCYPKFKGVCSADAYPIWSHEGTLTAEYLMLFMLSPYFEKRAVACSMRTGMPKINREDLQGIPIWFPSLKEQQRITSILAAWDDAIVTTGKLLANNRKQKRALMQKLLFGEKSHVGPESNWKHVKIEQIAERIQRQSGGTEHPILMISSGSGFVRQDEKYSRFMAGKSLDGYVLLKQGEFAYNKGNSKLYEFGCVFPLETYHEGLVPHVYVCFKLNASCNPAFFKFLFEADYLHDQLGALVNTGVRNNGLLNIKPVDFMNVRVPLPPLDEQTSIATVLEAASLEIKLRKEALDALKVQRRALMQQLLTGKRRASFPATVEAEAVVL